MIFHLLSRVGVLQFMRVRACVCVCVRVCVLVCVCARVCALGPVSKGETAVATFDR